MERATFDDLIAAKLQKEQKRGETRDIDVPSMGRALTFERPSDSRVIGYLDGIKDTSGTSDVYEAMIRMIYDACPIFRDAALRERLGVVEPTDAVRMTLTVSDVFAVGEELMKFLGIGELETEIKN